MEEGDVIASKVFRVEPAQSELNPVDSEPFKVIIKVLKPEPVEGAMWECPVYIKDELYENTMRVAGMDSMQALELAMTYCKTNIAQFRKTYGDALREDWDA